MVRVETLERVVEIPEQVNVRVTGRRVLVEGPLGKLEEDLSHLPVALMVRDEKMYLSTRWPRKREVGMLGTAAAHVRNMITGVTKGYRYSLKSVYAHFPVTVKADEKAGVFRIENFTGEKTPRFARIVEGVKVGVKGEEVAVEGIDLNAVSQTAANIQNATKIRQKDQRVFLDGIYIFEKGAVQASGKPVKGAKPT
jgi:large subunit ribosomal protein L6